MAGTNETKHPLDAVRIDWRRDEIGGSHGRATLTVEATCEITTVQCGHLDEARVTCLPLFSLNLFSLSLKKALA